MDVVQSFAPESSSEDDHRPPLTQDMKMLVSGEEGEKNGGVWERREGVREGWRSVGEEGGRERRMEESGRGGSAGEQEGG